MVRARPFFVSMKVSSRSQTSVQVQREQFADTSAGNQREPHDSCEPFRTGLQQRCLFRFAEDPRPPVVDLQIASRLPFDARPSTRVRIVP